MSLYSFFQKINYRFVAKSRHGVHSPFVYDFVEKVLNGQLDTTKNSETSIPKCEQLNAKQQIIVDRIMAQYSFTEVIFEGKNESFLNSEGKGKLYIFEEEISAINFEENDLVLLLNIYKSKTANEYWQELLKRQNVRLSLDIFELGLLFFQDEFKVKQHFILRY